MDFVALVMILFGVWLLDSTVKNRPPMATLRKILENPGQVTGILASTVNTGATVPRVGTAPAPAGVTTASGLGATVTGPGGGKIIPNVKGWQGYNPTFLAGLQGWAAATGKTFHITGMGGPRTLAEQTILWNRWLAGTGNKAANPYTSNRGGPHVRGEAADVSPHPTAEDIALMPRFGIGMTVPGEPWHIGMISGGVS